MAEERKMRSAGLWRVTGKVTPTDGRKQTGRVRTVHLLSQVWPEEDFVKAALLHGYTTEQHHSVEVLSVEAVKDATRPLGPVQVLVSE